MCNECHGVLRWDEHFTDPNEVNPMSLLDSNQRYKARSLLLPQQYSLVGLISYYFYRDQLSH